jgi:hypothetical protein
VKKVTTLAFSVHFFLFFFGVMHLNFLSYTVTWFYFSVLIFILLNFFGIIVRNFVRFFFVPFLVDFDVVLVFFTSV